MATKYRWDAFVLDLDAYRLERGGQPLTLEPKAFNLLTLMVPRPGHLFTKQEIFDAVWPGVAVTDHALTRVVAQVRRVLGDEAREARYLETVPTRGYRWIPATEVIGDAAPPVIRPLERFVTAEATPVPAVTPRPRSASGWMVATTLLAMLTLTLVIWAQRAAPESAPTDPKWIPANWPAQLTTHAGVEMHPSWSPHSDAMAYAANRTGAFEIYVRALQGPATETALTRNGGENVQPAWSPDGLFVAFHSYVRGGIWVVPARGGTARQVVAVGSRPAWTRDARRLVFQSDEHADISPDGFSAQNGSTLWSVALDGSDRRPLTRVGHPIGGHAAPVVSPDGRFIAFTVFDGGPSSGLWMLDTVSDQTWRLTDNVRVYEATFAPDGSALFASGGIARIVEIPLDRHTGRAAGRPRFLPVPEVPGLRGLALSPDGRTFSFFGAALSSQIWAQRLDDGRPAGAPAPLTSDTSRRNSWPSISPDGGRVVYASTRRGQRPNVWMLSLDGREPMQLSANAEGSYQPRWLADGMRVAYMAERGGTREVWTVDAETRRTDRLMDIDQVGRTSPVPLRGALAELALAPSMRRAVFSILAPPDGRRVLHYANLDPFEPRALTADTLSVGYPAWAPDERRVAVELRDDRGTQAAIVDVRTGDLRVLTRERGETWVRSWSPDGRRVAAAVLRAGVWNLQWFDVTTGQGGALTAPTPSHVYQRYPEWSPRGDLVVFERAEMSGDLWLLPVRRLEKSKGR